ncbi:hypothetical protein Cni_G18440 [Canna indica]|uniref:Secreted protein n=1 Tax=Canna indica TaxID=4628 RepID=A0AAQ3KJ98_9LILI|nr:hypothetical protein Cni_G18440 [Canna indica]
MFRSPATEVLFLLSFNIVVSFSYEAFAVHVFSSNFSFFAVSGIKVLRVSENRSRREEERDRCACKQGTSDLFNFIYANELTLQGAAQNAGLSDMYKS